MTTFHWRVYGESTVPLKSRVAELHVQILFILRKIPDAFPIFDQTPCLIFMRLHGKLDQSMVNDIRVLTFVATPLLNVLSINMTEDFIL